jgi:DNA repair protein SbcC/Rad50
MIIKKLNLQNIRSYENIEIEFPTGSVLLSGKIGSGKTSVLLGLQFALFGLQPGQKGSSLLRHGSDEAYARVEIEVDGEIVNIERTIKKGKNGSITQDKNIITTRDERHELSTSEIKSKVIELLNYPKEFAKKSNLLYKFTVYTPQEEMKTIIEERPEIRLNTIRHIFGIDRYKKIKENAGILLSKIKESIKIKDILIGELNLLKEKLQTENERKISLARETNNLNIEHNKIIQEKEKIEIQKQQIQEKIEKRREIDSQTRTEEAVFLGKKTQENKLKKDISNMQREINLNLDFSEVHLQNVTELYQKHRNLQENKTKEYMEINTIISRLESKKEIPMKLKEKIMSLDNCPTCFQTVGSEHKEKITKRTQFEINDITIELEDKLVARTQIIKDIEKEKQLIQGYEQDKNNLQQDKIKSEHQNTIQTKIKSEAFILDRTVNEIKSLEEKIKQLKGQQIENHIEEFNKINQQYDTLNQEIRRKEITLAEKNKELELVKINLEDLNNEITKKEKIKEKMFYLRNLQDWLQDKFLSIITITEKNVLYKLRTEFSEVFSEWFNLLVSDDLRVRLDEDFTPIISNQDYEMDYDFLSGGERTAVALAYRLSLNQVLNSMLSKLKTKGLIILDEPTDGFATEQIDKMRDLFDQLKAEQLILVSHEEKIEGFVDHIIKIKKDFSSTTE